MPWLVLVFLLASCVGEKASRDGLQGIRTLSAAELLAAEGFVPDLRSWEVLAGFKVGDDFGGDLHESYSLPMTLKVQKPSKLVQGRQVLVVAKSVTADFGSHQEPGLQPVGLAFYDYQNQTAEISLRPFNENLSKDHKLKRDNDNLAATYLLLDAAGPRPIAFVEGQVLWAPHAGGKAPVTDGLVRSSSAPFFVRTTLKHATYLLPVPKGESSLVTALDTSGAVDQFHDAGMAVIPAPGSVDLELFDQKVEPLSLSHQERSRYALNAGAADNLLAGLLKIKRNIHLTQYVGAGPEPVADHTSHGPQATKPELEASHVLRKADDLDPQTDLSCNGLSDSGERTLVPFAIRPESFAGWQYAGDVIATAEQHQLIFGRPEEMATKGTYLERTEGYCLLATGNGHYRRSDRESAQLDPIEGRSSQISQIVKVPAQAQSIQLRLALFSQEFPHFVGTELGDHIYARFDQSLTDLYAGSMAVPLNAAQQQEVADCGEMVARDAESNCGRWQRYGEALGAIGHSTQAVEADDFCPSGDKCYAGWTEPMVLCAELAPEWLGQQLTLRVGIAEGSDSYYDSALALDTVVFSTHSCDQIFTNEARL